MIVPIILGGGEGKRLWPLSRQYFPKQLQSLFTDHSLLQQTILRINHCADCIDPIIVSNKNYRYILEQQLSEINCVATQLIFETHAYNTAFAIVLTALWCQANLQNPLLLVLPVDHLITDEASFLKSLYVGKEYLEQDPQASILFATHPTTANSHFGYIKSPASAPHEIFPIEKFIEKPKAHAAKQMVKEGGHFWNTGIFLFYTNHILQEFAEHAPEILHAAKIVLQEASKGTHSLSLPKTPAPEFPKLSIDYALFEHASQLKMIYFSGEWHDVGNWNTLLDASPKDHYGNVKIGDVAAINSHRCYIRSTSRLVAAIGLEDKTVIETRDAVLVVDNQQTHEISNLVNKLVHEKRAEAKFYSTVIKPWGHYEVLFQDPHVQIKKLHINPGAAISTQLHKCRSEHWIIMSGKATVLKDSRELTLLASQSTYIPVGVKHRLANETSEPLELIEVQLGSYLADDDIIRFEDRYARSTDEI